jgi:hypothetical protein
MGENNSLYLGQIRAGFHPPHVVVLSSGFILLVVNLQLLWTRVYAEQHVGKVAVPWWSF